MLYFVDFNNRENITFDPEAKIKSGKSESVNAVRLSLIRRAGIVGENIQCGSLLILGEQFQQIIREIHF